ASDTASELRTANRYCAYSAALSEVPRAAITANRGRRAATAAARLAYASDAAASSRASAWGCSRISSRSAMVPTVSEVIHSRSPAIRQPQPRPCFDDAHIHPGPRGDQPSQPEATLPMKRLIWLPIAGFLLIAGA